jgi:hypothetical protein
MTYVDFHLDWHALQANHGTAVDFRKHALSPNYVSYSYRSNVLPRVICEGYAVDPEVSRVTLSIAAQNLTIQRVSRESLSITAQNLTIQRKAFELDTPLFGAVIPNPPTPDF